MPKKDKFINIGEKKRIWAIASVHGQAQRLRALHQSIAAEYKVGDIVVYLGNLIGVGSEIKETIDEFLLFRRALIASSGANVSDVVCLRGMQEEMWSKLLQLHYAQKPDEVLKWMLLQGVGSVIKAYGCDPDEALEVSTRGAVAISRWVQSLRDNFLSYDGHSQYINNLSHGAYKEDKQLFFSSAGFSGDLEFEKQNDNLWWESSKPFESTDVNNQGFEIVVRGYSSKADKDEVFFSKKRITLDIGCGFGGKLASCLFDENGKPIELIAV